MVRKLPARCYRKIERPYTRKSRYKDLNFIRGGAPPCKIQKFVMGNVKKQFKYKVSLICNSAVQIRDIALEASRRIINRHLEKKLGPTNYLFVIKKYPHHVLRHHFLATGAGADRYSEGMRLAYGRPIGLAAQVFPGDTVMEIYVDTEDAVEVAREAFRRVFPKMPGKFTVKVEKVAE